LSYFLFDLISGKEIIILSNGPIWLYALILMFIVSKLLTYLKLSKYVDYKVMSQITKILMNVAIVAAITSLSFQLIKDYLLPILLISLIIIGLTVLIVFVLNKYLFKD